MKGWKGWKMGRRWGSKWDLSKGLRSVQQCSKWRVTRREGNGKVDQDC